VEPGENVLVVNTGYFGDSFGDCAKTYGADVDHVNAGQIGGVPSLDEIKAALQQKKYKLVNITQVDTSTGVLTDVKAISELVHEVSPHTLVSVDGVCSIGAEEFYMDKWKVDSIITASQKALGVPSGLLIMAISERALKGFQERKTPVKNYFANFQKWLPIMEAYEAGRPSYFATPAVSLIISLNTSLKQILKEDLATRFRVHRETSDLVKNTFTEWGLKLVPLHRSYAANSLTAVYYPDGVTAQNVLPAVSSQGVVIAGGLHKAIAPKYFRVGHMGISAVEVNRRHVLKTLEVLKQVFKK
jgi:alanine-glyoxylate transaminase / serine-glyoxylate transaminase / serine-pyruvate transaminase